MKPDKVIVSGEFDDLRARDIRFLQEAARLGELSVLLWPDSARQKSSGQSPKFPLAERLYFLNAIRYVTRTVPLADNENEQDNLRRSHPQIWADVENPLNAAREKICREQKIAYRVFKSDELSGFPELPPAMQISSRKKVVVTGSFDWFHSGHVRFLEEASTYGDLYVIVGHDANIRLLKGAGHPLLSQEERRYVVGSIKFVTRALVSSGDGWLDADPEIQKLKPDIYLVNEDGDKGGKREYCQKHGIEYRVLKRKPADGLSARSSTALRGF